MATMQDSLTPKRNYLESRIRHHAVEQEIEALAVSLPVPPAPKVEPDTGEWLLDSARDYLDQLKFYKLRKTK